MTEQEKCNAGLMYDTSFPEREEQHLKCMDLCFAYNNTLPSNMSRREELLRQIFGKLGKNPYVEPTLFCGFGKNIEAGENFFVNNNCVFVDPGKITFGDNVFIGPSCGFYTAHHPIHPELRNRMYEYARPITVGSNVWIGGGTVVLPGAEIGDGTVIGAGSVVTGKIPANVVAFGNPCRVHRQITESDLREEK